MYNYVLTWQGELSSTTFNIKQHINQRQLHLQLIIKMKTCIFTLLVCGVGYWLVMHVHILNYKATI